MPPVTPSPHRFLAGAHRQRSPEKQNAPRAIVKPVARPADIDHTPKPPPSRYTEPPRSSQFAATPRFAAGSSRAKFRADRSPSPPKSTLVQALRSTGRRTEEVEETPLVGGEHEYEDEVFLTHEQAESLPAIEDTREDEQDWRHQLPYSPKRRRVGPGVDDDLPPTTTESYARQHDTEASAINSARPSSRFAHAPASQADQSNHQPSLAHPPFLRPTPAASELQDPLPDAFSPHRRGNKFIPGGMAAMLQQWVVETGQAAVHSRRARGLPQGNDYIMKVQIREVNGSAPLLVNAATQDNVKLKLMLITTPSSTEIMPGSIIGVRSPMWEIDLLHERWTVAVDWRALQ